MNKSVSPFKTIPLILSIFLIFSLTACGNKNKEYYKDGSLKSIGETSSPGGKQGNWQYFYNKGGMMSEGDYVNDKPNGKWTYWNSENKIVAEKYFRNGIEISKAQKEADPKVTKKQPAQPEPKHTPKAEPKSEDTTKHKAEVEPETTTTHEVKRTEPYVENRSGFAATMEEWKAMKKRKKAMPKVEAAVEIVAEEAPEPVVEPAPEPTPEPVHVPADVVEQKAEISEPVHTTPVQEVVAPPVAEIVEPAEREVEPVKEKAPAKKKKAVKSGGKFWQN